MNTTYDPKQFEKRLYDSWLKNKYFHADENSDKKPFTIVMPPPNITGQLHIGHALDMTLQDSITRYKRMKGYNALWLPGTDHASIATEMKIVDKLSSEGISKESLGRESFLKRAFEWKEQYGGTICKQLERLGASCDWDRLAFTMDENLSNAVRETFVQYYEKGWIYHGARIVNLCPHCKTAISDAEVEYETEEGSLWHIRYPATDGGEGLTVATTRPETMLGDTAVAVNPSDRRYSRMVGKTLSLPLTDREIPVIADDYVEKAFGSGAVKITPAHDPNDFEVGLRHNLETIRIMNDSGIMNENAYAFARLDRMEARKRIVEELSELGLLVKIEKHTHNVGHCHRCHAAIEPIVSKQWFLKMSELAKPAINAVKTGDIKFVPKRFDKNFLHWMENLRDWCISRQLWWGHRIPVFYCDNCGKEFCSREDLSVCPDCGKTLRRDEDVLDTWFSSALWPFSTLGWPNETADMKAFYPTDVLVTGYDIISFWVARMIFSGFEFTGEKPFSDVLIHGLVRDGQGRKLSKSLGNGIDPLEIIDEVGADVLRITLVAGISAGGDIKYLPKKQEGFRNFMNKIWNASRFVLMNAEGVDVLPIENVKLTIADKWLLSRLNSVTGEVTKNMDRYEVGLAANKLYDFIWSEFCDWYIELSKTELYTTNESRRQNAVSVLVFGLAQILKLAHPIIPFITAEIYSNLPVREAGDIMIASYPTASKSGKAAPKTVAKAVMKAYPVAKDMEYIMETIRAIRNLRSELNVKQSKRPVLYVVTSEKREKLLSKAGDYIVKLAYCSGILVVKEKPENCAAIITRAGDFYMPFGELIDYDKEVERLSGELETAVAELDRANSKLSNEGFVARAPAKVVEAEKAKITLYQERVANLTAKLDEVKSAAR